MNRIVPLLCLFSLTGCAAQLAGSPRLIDSRGVVPVNEVGRTPAGTGGVQNNRQHQQRTVIDGSLPTFRQRFTQSVIEADADPTNPEAINEMMANGFLLVRTNCDDFFADMAILQRDADIGRDMVAPILSALSNIVALRSLTDGQRSEINGIFAIASTTVLAGISIVDQHFLFGAENSQDVHDLTFDALAAHKEEVEEMGDLSFQDALEQLIDHQVICSPAYIRRLTRQAIQAGDVVADVNAGASADDAAFSALARELGRIGAVSPTQARALWALYMSGVPAEGIPAEVATLLNQAQLSTLIETVNGSVVLTALGREKKDRIVEILRSFSRPTRESMAGSITRNAIGTFQFGNTPRISRSGSNNRRVSLRVQ